MAARSRLWHCPPPTARPICARGFLVAPPGCRVAMVLAFAMLAACRTGSSPSVAKGNPGAAPRAEPRLDPEIFAMLSKVSERRMIAAVKMLVSCGTRNSCSVQLGPDKGIAAARDWLQKEFSAVEG